MRFVRALGVRRYGGLIERGWQMHDDCGRLCTTLSWACCSAAASAPVIRRLPADMVGLINQRAEGAVTGGMQANWK
jgi:hypothetical protein